jgi:hypothetical protein
MTGISDLIDRNKHTGCYHQSDGILFYLPYLKVLNPKSSLFDEVFFTFLLLHLLT